MNEQQFAEIKTLLERIATAVEARNAVAEPEFTPPKRNAVSHRALEMSSRIAAISKSLVGMSFTSDELLDRIGMRAATNVDRIALSQAVSITPGARRKRNNAGAIFEF